METNCEPYEPIFKDYYERLTSGGYEWGFISDDGVIVVGQVCRNGIWESVDWIKTFGGDLQSRHSKEYNIKKIRYPEYYKITVPVDRELNVPFVISTTRRARVAYSVSLTTSLSISGSDEAIVDLVVNDVVIHTVRNYLSAIIAFTLISGNTQQKILYGEISAGATVQLVSSGSGSCELIDCQETLL